MNYLITGGAGFIGLNVVKSILKKKNVNKIYILDNLSRASFDDELKEVIKNKKIIFIRGGIDKINNIKKVKNINFIFHFAGILGVKNVISSPYEALYQNISNLFKIIHFAKTQGNLKKFIFTSTSEVYAKSLEKKICSIPTPENIHILIENHSSPRETYALSKIIGEKIINFSNLPFIIFRPHNIFGPRMGYDHVIPQLTKKFLNKKKVMINNANHVRSFFFISDAIKYIDKISHSKINGQVINLGTDKNKTTIMELAKKISQVLMKLNYKKNTLLGSKNRVVDFSPAHRVPCVKKLIKLSGGKVYNEKFSNTLEKTVKWYLKN